MSALPIPQALALAFQHHQAGRLKEAVALCRQILASDPRHADALHLYGVIALQVGRNEVAVDSIRQAIALAPNDSTYHSNLGEAYRRLGQLEKALAAFRRAIQINPDYAEAHIDLGIALRDQGHLEEAVAAYRRAIQLKPDYANAHSNLGNALRDQGHITEAIAAFRRAIQLRPGDAEAHSNLGAALLEQGLIEQAMAAYRRAIQLKPTYAEAYSNLGMALRDQGHIEEAIAACRRAIQLKPDCSAAHSNLGNALRDQGHITEAIAAFQRAIQLRPGDAEAHSNLGAALLEQGQLDQAMAACRQAIQLRPDFPAANWNASLVLLLQGDFEHGLPIFEARWELDDRKEAKRKFPQPMWKSEALNSQRVFLHAEQGLGDTLQLIRYAPLVAQRGGHVIVECQPGLKALLAAVEGISQIIELGEPLPEFDLHCPLMSLPLAFGTRVETIPAAIPYLRADAAKATQWQERLEQVGGIARLGEASPRRSASAEPGPRSSLARPGEAKRSLGLDALREADPTGGQAPSHHRPLKVGLVWAGGERPNHPRQRPVDQRRSMRLSQFAPLAAVPGVTFISLQKGAPAAQAKTPPSGMRLLDWTEELNDFADTAALIECLDLVISVDTAVAHLAGALGKPVWLLNRFDTCWRWFTEREDSPWYPTMRLFRQPRYMDWEPVIASVREQLQLLAETAPGRTKPLSE